MTFKLDKYKPEYCQMLIDHLRKGFSLSTFGGHVLVTRQTVYEWIERHPEFAEAKAIGEQLGQHFFEKTLMAHVDIDGDIPEPNPTRQKAAEFALRTRYHKQYSDKQHQEQQLNSIEDYIRNLRKKEDDK